MRWINPGGLSKAIQGNLVLKLIYLNYLVGMKMRITFFSALEETLCSVTQHILIEGVLYAKCCIV